MCNCRISKSCVRCVLGTGDLSSNSYSGVFMTAFLMINVLLVNLLERFDTGKNKKLFEVSLCSTCMCIWECMAKRKVYLLACIFYVSSLEGYKFVYN